MLRKNQSPEVIADILGEDRKRIDNICKVAEGFAPEFEYEAVSGAWMRHLG